METIRPLILRRSGLALWLAGFVLVLRMIVPVGYMIGAGADGRPTIELCSGMAAVPVASADPHAAMAHHHAPARKSEAPADAQPCAFGLIAAPALSGADPVLLVEAVRFIVATVHRLVALAGPAADADHLTPPLRGPPAAA